MTITCTLLVLLGAVKDQLASQTGEVSERSEGGGNVGNVGDDQEAVCDGLC